MHGGCKNLFAVLPEDVTEIILARVPMNRHQNLFFTSRGFRCLIQSPSLYHTRERLGVTEPVLYLSYALKTLEKPSLHVVHRNERSWISQEIASKAPLPWGATVVSVASKIYVIGGNNTKNYCEGWEAGSSDAMFIDCISHKTFSLPSMSSMARYEAAGAVMDGKIYVVGGCEPSSKAFIEVFDIKNQTWSTVKQNNILPADMLPNVMRCGVIGGKLYVYCFGLGSCYNPKEDLWADVGDDELSRGWWGGPVCVFDDMLICLKHKPLSLEGRLNWYDVKEKKWYPVMGLEESLGLEESIAWNDTRLVNLGGRLLVLSGGSKLRCVEIKLQKGELGDMWGTVLSDSPIEVKSYKSYPHISHCLTVII